MARLLEASAERAAARGGFAAQARALERAARLSPERRDRARRLAAAATAATRTELAHARALVEEAMQLADDPLVHADLVYRAADLARMEGADVSEEVLLRELDVAGLDDERTAKLLELVVILRSYALDAAGAAALASRLEAAARGVSGPAGAHKLAMAAGAYLLAGERERGTTLLRELARDPEMPAASAWNYLALEWYDELRASSVQNLQRHRARGNRLGVAYVQSAAAHLELRCGRLTDAAATAAEAIAMADTGGFVEYAGVASCALGLVHAWRGQADACRAAARVGLDAAQRTGDKYHDALAHHALALFALGAGRPGDVINELERFARRWAESTVVEPGLVPFMPDLIEAYVMVGAREEATVWLERFARVAAEAERTWARAASARCEGLLAPLDAFDDAFSRGLELLERSPYALDLARMRLAYGERLRRAGRRRDARMQLRPAFDMFATAGAVPWEARAAAELRAAGEHVSVEARPLPDLTPQELHIASLVAEGKTNKEIGAAIYLSPKTVQYHLANAYRKLDIHSRAELARIMARDHTLLEAPA